MIIRGKRVVRVSLRSLNPLPDEGKLGEQGYVLKVFMDVDGTVFGYHVVWDAKPNEAQYCAPVRIAEIETCEPLLILPSEPDQRETT